MDAKLDSLKELIQMLLALPDKGQQPEVSDEMSMDKKMPHEMPEDMQDDDKDQDHDEPVDVKVLAMKKKIAPKVME